MTALIVWNNGESYDGNKTYCIAVDPAELDDAVKLLRLDWQGYVMAFAKDAECFNEPYSLDDVLDDRSFSICMGATCDEESKDKNLAVLLQLSAALRKRVAKALLYTGGYHESHDAAIEAIVEKLGGYEPAKIVPSTAAQRMIEDA